MSQARSSTRSLSAPESATCRTRLILASVRVPVLSVHVENHIKRLHAQLQITPAEQPQWDQFAQVMRENARDMDQAFLQRAQQYPTMNAMQNMQSYEQMAGEGSGFEPSVPRKMGHGSETASCPRV